MQKEGKISYADFVWFLISEEDKKTPTRWASGAPTQAWDPRKTGPAVTGLRAPPGLSL